MKVIYDPAEDVLSIHFSTAPIAETSEGKPMVLLDYDQEGNLVGLEIMDASMRIENPRFLEYAIRT